jgi:hypothetical protein
MAIDYVTSAGLMIDNEFNGRVKIACLHFASYITDEDVSVPAHTTRMKWAQDTTQNPVRSVDLIMPILIMDAKVQEFGGAITDADLQAAVETSVNKTF